MTVKKTNGFAAPYRSLTLRKEKNALVVRNGILSISGVISSDSSNITIPPFSVIQQGLLIEDDSTRTIPFPLALVPPFALTVSSPTPSNVDDLTFQFGRSPFDIQENETVLATYDGTGWTMPPMLSIDGLLKDLWQANIDLKKVGVQNGLITKIVGSNYVVESGVIIDKTGQTIRVDKNLVTPIIESDPLWNRVDRFVYRRETDDIKRIGSRKLLIGNTFSSGAKQIHNQQIDDALIKHTNVRTLVDSQNNVHFLYAEGFGNSYSIKYQKFDESRANLLVAESLITGTTSSNFDVAIDADDTIHMVYESSGVLRHIGISNVGVISFGPFNVHNGSEQCSKPVIVIDSLNLKLFIAYQVQVSPTSSQIYFSTRDLSGSIISSSVNITNNATQNYTNPCIEVSSDLMVFVAYENSGIISYVMLDDIGAIKQAAKIVSNNTESTSFGVLSNNASNPKIKISDNKELFIAFRQRKNLTDYGITIWNKDYAYMPNLFTPLENIAAFDFIVDDFMNELHFTVSRSNSVDYVKIDNLTVVMVENIGAGSYDNSVKKDKKGSLIHCYSTPLSSSYIDIGPANSISAIGPSTVGSVVIFANEIAFQTSGLTHIPVVGERITITGSASNDGSKIITQVRNEPGDVTVVTVDSNYAGEENPCAGAVQFAYPQGNEVRTVKTVSEISEARALRNDVLDSDILLSRLKFPGPVILNYIPSSGSYGANSDLFGMYGAVDVDWSAATVDALTMTTGAKIVDLVTHNIYTLSGGTFPMNNGDALYVVLDGVTFNVAPAVTTIEALPWGLPIQVLGFVEDGEFNPHLFAVAGMGKLDVGEEVILGQDLSKQIRQRLGITSETSYQNYSSNKVISLLDNYPTAVSKLDNAIGNILESHAVEETILITTPTTIITATEIDWSDNNSVPDIQVFVNDRRVWLGASADYLKISETELEFNYQLPTNAVIGIRKERTGGSGSAGGVDLTNVTTDISPITNGAFSVGSSTKGMKKLYLKDTVTNTVYSVSITEGVFDINPVS